MVVDPVGDPALTDVDEAIGVGSHRPVDTDRSTRGRRISKVQPSELEPCCGSGVRLVRNLLRPTTKGFEGSFRCGRKRAFGKTGTRPEPHRC
jgi:hypothetical protein